VKYDALYFIKKFEAIPEDQWCAGIFYDDLGRKCAYGHCGVEFGLRTWTEEGHALKRLFIYELGEDVARVNDHLEKFGKKPKERILNALRLINAGVEL